MSLHTRREMLAGLVGVSLTTLVSRAGSAAEAEWTPLWDGESLKGWKQAGFREEAEAKIEKAFKGEGAAIVLPAGKTLSGINWTGVPPKMDYEIELEAMKTEGGDFFCALTFPVAESHATLVLGGWGGEITGISNIDNSDASENPTTKFINYPKDKWFKVRLRVTPKKLEAWLDEKQIVDQDTTDRKISLRPGPISLSVPLGLATYQTSAAYRNIRMRKIKG